MMYFPEHLIEYYKLYKQAGTRSTFPCENLKIKDILRELRQHDTFWDDPHLFFCDHSHVPLDKIANDAEYEYCINPELRRVMRWISRRVLSTIGIDNYLSTNVFVRIGTSMLNKLVYNGELQKEFGIYYHDNLVSNTNCLLSVINTEDLPF